MKVNLSDKIIAYLTLLSGLSISAVAVWYSVAGLVSIFAAAVIPIIIMGVALEVSKLIATVWLKLNWQRAPIFIRTYLLAAIAILMVITSMGIFGFLSKAHSDAGLVSGDVMAKISVYDEKIKTAKDNIDANRKALKQMDEAVDQVMGRSQDEKGADKAVALRRTQQKERARLQSEITAEQKTISVLAEERAPIAAEVRKVEAEVGPIKYIAAFVYGSNPDANVLEKAVTWVIIIIVSVFDPLAVILLLASQYSFQWFRKQEEEEAVAPQTNNDPATEDQIEQIRGEPFIPAVSPWWPFPTPAYINKTEESVVEEQPLTDDKQLMLFDPDGNPTDTFTHTETHIVPSETPSSALGGDITAPEEKAKSDIIEDVEPDNDYAGSEPDPAVKSDLENDHEEQGIYESAHAEEKAAMTAWKATHPESNLKIQKRLYERGLIKELPWQRDLSPVEDFSQDEAAEEAAKWAEEQIEKSKKKDNELDRESRVTTDQKEQRKIEGYVQNAEQGDKTIWQRIKKGLE